MKNTYKLIGAQAGAYLIALLLLTGCDQFRNRVETQRIRVDRNDPKTGKPIKIGFIASNKPVKVPVVYELEDGSTVTEEIDVNGFDVSPPPLPEK